MGAAAQALNVIVEPAEITEQVRAPDHIDGFPGGKDHQGHGQPAQGLDGAVTGPGAFDVVHGVVQAAQAGNARAQTGGHILVAGDVDTGGVGGGRVFAHGPQVQARAGAVEEPGHTDGQDQGYIDQKAMAENHLAEGTQVIGKGQAGPVDGGGGGHGNLAHTTGQGVQCAAEEIGDTAAEDGQRQTGDVLVDP